jgi:hypothetical protein
MPSGGVHPIAYMSLEELRTELAMFGYGTLWRFFRRRGWTRKKTGLRPCGWTTRSPKFPSRRAFGYGGPMTRRHRRHSVTLKRMIVEACLDGKPLNASRFAARASGIVIHSRLSEMAAFAADN